MNRNYSAYNRWWIGIIAGLIAPVIGFFIFYLLKYNYMTLSAFIRFVINGNVYTQVMSLCVIANLPVFFAFIQYNLYNSAKGVILTTILYTIINFILKAL
jgi:hypothetical protein